MLITSNWVFGSVSCNFHGFFGVFVIYISPVTLGLMAFNRYTRICKSEQQYKRIFSPWKSRGLLACVWIFVACYTAAPKLASLQDFVFVPGYALCAPAHLSEIGKMFHYAFVVIWFLLIPLLTAIFSYIKISKTIQQHNADVNYNPETRNIQSHYYACDQDKQITFRSCASLLHSRFWCRHATPLPIKMGAEL